MSIPILPDQASPTPDRGVAFIAYGIPAPQGSKKHVGNGRMVEMSKRLPEWRGTVVDAARDAMTTAPIDNPVEVVATFYLPEPKKSRFGAHPAGAPDLDKLMRALGDALKLAGVVTDDSRIVREVLAKKWGDPRVEVTVREVAA